MNCAVRQVTDLFTSRNGYLFQPILENWAGGASCYTGLLMSQAGRKISKTHGTIQKQHGPKELVDNAKTLNVGEKIISAVVVNIRAHTAEGPGRLMILFVAAENSIEDDENLNFWSPPHALSEAKTTSFMLKTHLILWDFCKSKSWISFICQDCEIKVKIQR